jgi:ribosomal protein L16 Arg81 hydroxylase
VSGSCSPAGRSTAIDRPALRRCVAGDIEEFATTYWANRPLLSKAVDLPSGFDDLLTLEAVDELVARRGLRTPFLRIAKNGQVVPNNRFTRSGGAGAQIADQVADDRVLDLFLDGATLVLQGLHRVWPPLIDFAGRLSSELGHPVQVNAYVTPPSAKGFAAHYDVHDVFVLQVAGEKRWIVHQPVHPAPLRDQPWTDHRQAVAEAVETRPPTLDTVLRPGDSLYLPRGYLHSAEALGGVTAHLTVGVHPVTRHAIVEALCALAADEPSLRTSLPLGVDAGAGAAAAQVESQIATTIVSLREWLQTADQAAVAEKLRTRLGSARRPAPISPLAQAAATRQLDHGSVVRLRGWLRPTLRAEDGQVVLDLPDRRITLALTAETAVKALLDGADMAVRDLPGLPADEQLALAARLLREAVIVPVTP